MLRIDLIKYTKRKKKLLIFLNKKHAEYVRIFSELKYSRVEKQ